MRTNTSPATRTVRCPKCAGTGIVSRFLDHEAGRCFDCNGIGRVAAPITAGTSSLKTARAIGDAILAGDAVDTEAAATAFATFEGLARAQWSTRDYDRRNALALITSA